MDNAPLAPESFAAGFDRNLAPIKAGAESGPLPTTIAAISLRVRDSEQHGTRHVADGVWQTPTKVSITAKAHAVVVSESLRG